MVNPTNQPNYDGLANEWYKLASGDKEALDKWEVYAETDKVASSIEKLVDEGKTKEARYHAKTILKTFEKLEEKESKRLTDWIFSNTLQSGSYVKGASKSFCHLADAIRSVSKLPTQGPHEKAVFERSLFGFIYSYFFKTPSPPLDSSAYQLNKIASNAEIQLKETDFSILEPIEGQSVPKSSNHLSIQRDIHQDPIIPDDILKLVVRNTVQQSSPKDLAKLRKTSKLVDQQVAIAYRGPLKDIGITTADQVIAHVKKCGDELEYIDISGINFSDIGKFRELIEKLPNLTTFIARNSSFDSQASLNSLAVEEIAKLVHLSSLDLSGNKSQYFKFTNISKLENLVSLDLSSNKIGPLEVPEICKLKKLQNLNLSWTHLGHVSLEEIAKLKNLISLDLSGNRISGGITELEKLVNLQVLNLSANRINGITEIVKLVNLLTLDVSGNSLSEADEKELLEALKNTRVINIE